MSTITETSEFSPEIFQIDTSTPLRGGAPTYGIGGVPSDGHLNAGIEQLANRTRWLKDELDKVPTTGAPVVEATASTDISITSFTPGSFNTIDANTADITLTLEVGSIQPGSEFYFMNNLPGSTYGITAIATLDTLIIADGLLAAPREKASVFSVKYVGNNTWIVFGDLATA